MAARRASGLHVHPSTSYPKPLHRSCRRHAPMACEGTALVHVDGVGALPFRALGGGLDGRALDALAAPGDYYELLGLDVSADCSEADVKAAYRRLQKV